MLHIKYRVIRNELLNKESLETASEKYYKFISDEIEIKTNKLNISQNIINS